MKNKYLHILKLILCCVLINSVNTVNAAAIAEASGFVSLRVLDIKNLTTPGDLANFGITRTSFDLSDSEGDAELAGFFGVDEFNGESSTITSNGVTVDMNIGSPFLQLASAEAESSATEDVAAVAITGGLISLTNDSLTDTFEVEFSLDYRLIASLTDVVSDLFLNDALAISDIFIADASLNINIRELIEIKTGTGPQTGSIVEDLLFNLTIAPGFGNELFIGVNSAAVTHVVPEPSIYLLLAIGLCLFSWQQRQQGIYSKSTTV